VFTGKDNVEISKRIDNDSHLLKEVSREVTDELRVLGAKESLIFDIRVAMEEALRNAMIHGNKMDPGKKVKFEARVSGENIMITIEDEGKGFEPVKVPDPTDEDNILKTSGRGVYLIKHLMDEVKYENGGRRVIMVKCLK
jgi:serine/threonine-protein kinase RsbW